MSNQPGFDYDLLISRLHGGLRAFQSLRAHRRERDQPPSPAPEESRATPPPRSAQPLPDEPGEMPAASPLEPQAFISVNGRIVPLFGELGAGMFARPAPAGAAPPSAGEKASTPPQSTPTPAPAETRSSPLPTAPAPVASPLRLSPPTPPARLGLIYGGQPHSAAAEPGSTTTSSDRPASPNPGAPASTATDGASAAALAALLDSHAKDEALRLERVHAEHRSFVEVLLREHREALRAQSEAHAAQTAQLLRDVLTEHRAELTRVAQTHADQLVQVLSQHRQEAPPQREPTPPDDELRSALIEHAKCQREANQDTAEHIGALTTIVADLGQTVGMMAMAAVRPGNRGPVVPLMTTADRTEPTAATSPHVTTDGADRRPAVILAEPESSSARATIEAIAPPGASAVVPAIPSDRARVLKCVGDDLMYGNHDMIGDGEHAPGSSGPARARSAVREGSDGGVTQSG